MSKRPPSDASTRFERGLEHALILLGASIIAAGFVLPWLSWESPLFLGDLVGLPSSQSVEGFRIPRFAREVDRSWLLFLTGHFQGGETPDPAWAYLVWVSPALALLGLGVGWGFRAPLLLRGAASAQFAIALFMSLRLAQGLEEAGAWGVEVRPSEGLWASALGHVALGLSLLNAAYCRNR
ncbi:MAG: hypothetical protein KDB53_19775 [Planctomycetes bacterium]|nr:hypothetical protein [Planctomycetota bacterium]